MTKLDVAYMKQVSKGLSKVFNDALQNNTNDYKKIATVIKANTISVDYGWVCDLLNMREWVGDREIKELSTLCTITRKKWESTIQVQRDVIEYDNLGIVKPRVQSMAQSIGDHYDDLVFGLLEKNGPCYDNKNFFATDHSIGDKSFSNLYDLELTQENLLQLRQKMRSIVNEYGKPLRLVPNLLVIPPELEAKALEILNAQYISSGNTNITYKICDYHVCDRLSDPNAWYLMDTSKVIKPIILQINRQVEFVALDNPNDENVFMKDAFLYGTRSEDNAGYGLWQLAMKSKPSVAKGKKSEGESA